MNRITKLATLVGIPSAIVVGLIATSGAANAATVKADGSVSVSKAEVQSALHLNNAGFDAAVANKTLHFTGIGEVENHTRVTYSVGDQSWSYETAVDYKAGDATATQVLNGNGKQITGFTVTGSQGAFDKVEYPVAGSMIPAEASGAASSAAYAAGTTPTVKLDSWTVTHLDGVSVNGVVLPVTPAV